MTKTIVWSKQVFYFLWFETACRRNIWLLLDQSLTVLILKPEVPNSCGVFIHSFIHLFIYSFYREGSVNVSAFNCTALGYAAGCKSTSPSEEFFT